METQCTHLNQIREVSPNSEGCEKCLQMGGTWVHLRMCLTCGHVGCCDESPNKHATGHFEEQSHPIMRSIEPGENWLWCYVDRTVMYPTDGAEEGYEDAATDAFLRHIPLFAELNQEDLNRIYNLSQPIAIAEGETLVREGDSGDSMYVVLSGEFEVTKRSMGSDVVLSRRAPGEFVGEMSLLAGEARQATVRALKDSRVLVISRFAFEQLLAFSPSAGLSVLRTMAQRLKSNGILITQQEKMAGLGRLTAGLAHELNNPAAAAWRSADQLTTALTEWQQLSSQLDSLALDHSAMAHLGSLREELGKRATMKVSLDPLTRSDREYDVENWLEERRVDNAWELAPALVSMGWDVTDLEEWIGDQFAGEHLNIVIPWLVQGAQCYVLLGEVKMSTERIAEIVKAVKSYSYLDQAAIQEVDIRVGLDNTLVILKHKLKTGVEVNTDYQEDLEEIEAYASELNQVWTNLIDNAIDAMEGNGTLTIRTRKEDAKSIAVEIEDTGPGIPPDLQSRIYQPFFTTKDVGKGTGLGLHIVYNIVVDKHHGQIALESEPGRTCFKVTLPLKLVRE